MADQYNGSVLYIEDEEGDILFMRMAFTKAGLGTWLHTVGDGREAIEYLSGNGPFTDRGLHPVPEVVLLDINLPVFSGFEVLKWMRSRPDYKKLPVIVFTSSSRDEDRKKALALGANDFVEKPNSAFLFAKVVKRVKEEFLGRGD